MLERENVPPVLVVFSRPSVSWRLAGCAATSVNSTLEVKDFYCGFYRLNEIYLQLLFIRE